MKEEQRAKRIESEKRKLLQLTVKELKIRLSRRNLPIKGKKDELIDRLVESICEITTTAAQARTTAQQSISIREVNRRREEAYDWLCCVGDNALTAMCAEAAMDTLQESLNQERSRALESLHNAIVNNIKNISLISSVSEEFQIKNQFNNSSNTTKLMQNIKNKIF